MLIHYASDIHLEFDPPMSMFYSFTGGDILILAGDITNYKQHNLDMLDELCRRYEDVIMVMGNHEHYGGKFPLTYNRLDIALPDNVYLLENELVEINGQRFLGCSLWSWMNEVDQYFAKIRMNDYKVIRNGPHHSPWLRKLNPLETVATHMQSALWLENNVSEGDIVITHHAPSFKSCNPDYVGNTAYATDLSDIMLDTNPAYWIHGHLHEAVNYKIGNTTVTSNPMGYYESNSTSNFKVKEILL